MIREIHKTQVEQLNEGVYRAEISGHEYLFIQTTSTGFRIARRDGDSQNDKFHYIGTHNSLEGAVVMLEYAGMDA